MKMKLMSKFALLGLTASFVIPGNIAFGETPSVQNDNQVNHQQKVEIQDSKPSIKVTDKNSNLIKDYTNEEINTLMSQKASFLTNQQIKSAAYNISVLYKFGKTSFSKSVWIGGSNTAFYNPTSVELTPEIEINALSIQVYDTTNTYIGEVTIKGITDVFHVPITSLAKSGNYKIKLQNRDFLDVELSGGKVYGKS
ncbi:MULTISPECIES: hypothetical protein [Bacillus cereus group]|uniref:Uncharacterized protein n=1 Tax=Bacillus proteolyticus TaxID=2026192 RepID=A0ABV3IFB3_9BACI|nr:hypothetical protein [Bacillus cereus group sp. N8]MBJ8107907.1 hypothetical protein [Bacillus cereus group sp. N8]